MIDTGLQTPLDRWTNEGGRDDAQPGRAPLNVLVIEDDAMIAMLYAEVLVQIGHQVCGMASTEDQAVILAERLLPDLIIADLGLREGSGMMAIRRILRDRNVPHLYVTGSDVHPGLTADPCFMLRKPFSEQQLVEAMQCAMAVPEPAALF
jgi:DNA-binding response OmpR family regulator